MLGVWTGRDGGECGRGTAGNGRERVLGVWTGRDGGECGRGTAGNGRERVLGQWWIYDLIKGVTRVKYACAPTFSGEPRPLFDRGAVGSPGCARSVCVG